MHQDGRKLFIEVSEDDTTGSTIVDSKTSTTRPPLTWDWTIEHEDRRRERKVDDALHAPTPFEVDRKILKDVVREKMGVEVGRIRFLSAGESGFHSTGLVSILLKISPPQSQELFTRYVHFCAETKIQV
jgi:hypothetical protein